MGETLDYLYCFLYVAVCVLQGAVGEYAYITVDPMLDGQGQCSLPSTVRFSFETENETLTLDLTRNDHVHPSVPSYIIQVSENGVYGLQLEERTVTKRQAAYQDLNHEAAVFVSCNLHPKEGAKFEMEGTLFVEGVKYRILPSKSTVPIYRRLFHAGNKKPYHLLRAKEAVPFDSGIEAYRHEDILSNTLEEIRLPERPTRVKRAVAGEPIVINIDVLVLLEYSVIKVWETREGSLAKGKTKAKEYFAHVLNAVNLRYQRIENEEYKYNIRLVGFHIAETAAASPWSEDSKLLVEWITRINASQVLTDLQQWVNSSRDQLVPYDHIMLFTSYDLIGVDNGFRFNYTTGYAFVGTMCNTEGYSISVVEDHGGFQSVGTAAHELGHSLGAEHDGSNNACRPSDRYVMAPQSFDEAETNKFNPWFFSNCSVDYFVNYTNKAITDPKLEACLTEPLTPKDVPDVTGQMPGQLYNPDEQCQHQYGNKSYLCRGVNFDVNNLICRGMFCYQNETGTAKCVALTAARGTTCGNKKWCINGACVESSDAPAADDNCPHGDQPYVRTLNGDLNCGDTVSQQPGLCYEPGWSSQCCASCKEACDGPPDCLCRDHQRNCRITDCGGYNETTRAACCYTCKDYTDTTSPTSVATSSSPPPSTTATTPTTSTEGITYPSTCSDVGQFDGLTCADYVQDRGSHVCYIDHVNRSCCDACKNRMINSTFENCEWGDHTPESCFPLNAFVRGAVCPNGILMKKCCKSCENMDTALKNSLNNQQPTGRKTPTNRAASICASVSIFASLILVLYMF